MRDIIYEVRFPNNLDPDFVQRFSSKNEACTYAYDFPDAEIYMLTVEYDDQYGIRGDAELISEVQIKGPEMDANLADDTIPNSCDGDCDANYDSNGEYRAPVLEDDLDDAELEAPVDESLQRSIRESIAEIKREIASWGDEVMPVATAAEDEFIDEALDDADKSVVADLVTDEEEAITGYETAKAKIADADAKKVFDHIKSEEQEHIEELNNLDDDMTDEELGEALFKAIGQPKAKEAALTEASDGILSRKRTAKAVDNNTARLVIENSNGEQLNDNKLTNFKEAKKQAEQISSGKNERVYVTGIVGDREYQLVTCEGGRTIYQDKNAFEDFKKVVSTNSAKAKTTTNRQDRAMTSKQAAEAEAKAKEDTAKKTAEEEKPVEQTNSDTVEDSSAQVETPQKQVDTPDSVSDEQANQAETPEETQVDNKEEVKATQEKVHDVLTTFNKAVNDITVGTIANDSAKVEDGKQAARSLKDDTKLSTAGKIAISAVSIIANKIIQDTQANNKK